VLGNHPFEAKLFHLFHCLSFALLERMREDSNLDPSVSESLYPAYQSGIGTDEPAAHVPIPQPRNPFFSLQDFSSQLIARESCFLFAPVVLKQPQIKGHGDHVFVRWVKGVIRLHTYGLCLVATDVSSPSPVQEICFQSSEASVARVTGSKGFEMLSF
jgi:hypothetical protein